MKKINSRLVAAIIIKEVLQGKSLSDSLTTHLAKINDARDRAFIQAICYGICRLYPRLEIILGEFLKKSLSTKDDDVYALLLIGLYQLSEMQVAEHAAVSETVAAAKQIKKPWSVSLINAILRNYLRKKTTLQQKILQNESAKYAHPRWLINKIKTVYPDNWQAILAANNMHPPFVIRVNRQKVNRDDYLKNLLAEKYVAELIPETTDGILLQTPISVQDLLGFSAGLVSVQDAAAQCAASLLALQPGQLVLDACAAPGGKLTHLLEVEPQIICVAVEKEAARVPLINENLTRLNLAAEVICADASDVKAWWHGKLFDRILLDAPCSASGVIRRHPDIKLLRKPSDIKNISATQEKLLQALWPLLKSDGLLLYVTCSIFPEENEQVVKQFLKSHNDAKEKKISANWGIEREIGRQILPGTHHMDGFYYALLEKG